MEPHEAIELVRGGVARAGETWADLGSGSGTFTRALSELLGPSGSVYAVDSRPDVLAEVVLPRGAPIVPLVADFTQPLPFQDLDGVLMANSLHFVEANRQAAVLESCAGLLRSGGALVLVEYDQSRGNPWVPYPVPPARFRELAQAAALSPPREIGRRRSRYGPKDIYAAVALRE